MTKAELKELRMLLVQAEFARPEIKRPIITKAIELLDKIGAKMDHQEKAPVCEECDEEMSLNTGPHGEDEWRCDSCGWVDVTS